MKTINDFLIINETSKQSLYEEIGYQMLNEYIINEGFGEKYFKLISKLKD